MLLIWAIAIVHDCSNKIIKTIMWRQVSIGYYIMIYSTIKHFLWIPVKSRLPAYLPSQSVRMFRPGNILVAEYL